MKEMNLGKCRKVLGGEQAISHIIQEAEKDRYALIIPEAWEAYVYSHLDAILAAYPCTGILVRQSYSDVAFHVLHTDCTDRVMEEGVPPCMNEGATYGAGVIYAYPTPAQAAACDTAYGVFRIEYGPGTLRAIYTDDKDKFMQGVILIPPECVQYAKLYMTRVPGDTRLLYV